MGQNFIPQILIVESYGSNAKSISTHLAGLPFPLQIIPAIDAQSAIALTQSQPVDLALIDAGLRGNMDGFDLCHALRACPATQQLAIILLLCGYLSLERSRGISAGADLLLHRPIVKEELLRMIQLLLAEKIAQLGSAQSTAGIHTVRKLRSVS